MRMGIDPGLNGAVAILDDAGLVEVWDIPTVEIKIGSSFKRRLAVEVLASEIGNWSSAEVCFMEAVGASPQMGVTSAFAFGEGFGVLKGILAAHRIPLVLVPPAKWKRDLKLNAAKDGSRAKAMQLWPGHAQEFKRVKDADRAEAALLAEWGRRFHQSNV
jgi:crossover junction endodeoxyribonuclease RuvC